MEEAIVEGWDMTDVTAFCVSSCFSKRSILDSSVISLLFL